jgi:hypothetical protein
MFTLKNPKVLGKIADTFLTGQEKRLKCQPST